MKQSLLLAFCALLLAGFARSQVSISANHTSGCSPLGVVISVTSPSASNISSYAWTITRPDGTQHLSTNSQYVAIFSQVGTYDVSLTINGNQSTSLQDYITVFANPVASYTAEDPVGCFPHAVTFHDTSTPGSAPITTWEWDFGNGSTGNGSTTSHTYPVAGNFTPVLSIEDANGCFAAVALPGLVQVLNTFPQASFTSPYWLTCNPPAELTFTNVSTGNSALTSSWNFGDGTTLTPSGNTPVSHTFGSTGTFPVCLTVSDANGCTDQHCQSVTIFSQANPGFTPSNTTVCNGQPVTFSNTTQPAAPQYRWDFNADGNWDAFSAQPVYVFPAPGTYQPVLQAIYSPTCSGTFQGPVITVQPGLVANFTANQSQSCQVPFQVTFQNTSPGSGLSSNWFINGQNVGSGSPFTYTFNQFGVYDITLLSANALGCSSQNTQNDLIAIQPPQISFAHPAYICAGDPLEISDLSVSSSGTVTSYSWDFNEDGIEDATGTSPAWSYPSMGTYDITLTITTSTGCTTSYTSPTPILVLSSLNTGFTSSTTNSCAGQSIEFCVNSQPGNQFSWNFGDGTGWITMNEGEWCITHDYQDTGYFDVTLTVFNGACNATVTIEDYMYITPPVAIFEYAVQCSDLLTVSFQDLSIEAQTLVWDFGDGSAAVTNDTQPVHVFPAPGTYEVTLTAINDALGCPDVSTVSIHLVPPDPSMDFTLTSTCPPALVDLYSDAASESWDISISNGDSLDIAWSDEESRWIVQYAHGDTLEYAEFTANQDFWPTLIFEQAGCYDVHVLTTDAHGCTAEATYTDAVCVSAGTDFASFTPQLVEACDSVLVHFVPNTPGLVSWNWTFGDGQTSAEESPEHVYLPPYNYGVPVLVTLSASDSGGCSSTVTQPVSIPYPVIPSFTISETHPCAHETVQFTNTTSGPAVSYSWDFGDPASGSANTSGQVSPSYAYPQSGDFTVCLSATNAAGCTRTTCADAGVHVMTPGASFTYQSAINNCLYGVSFQSTSSGVVNSISWDFGDNQAGTGVQVYHTYPLGVYDVTMIVSNTYGCSDTTVVYDLFNYGDVIGPYSAVIDSANCAPFDATLTAFNPADTYFTYFWDFDDGYGDPSGSTVSSHTYMAPGTYCPSLIMTDPNGCDVLVPCNEPIVVEELVLEITADAEICAGESIQVQIENADSYAWDPGTPVVSGGSTGSYILTPSASGDFHVTGYYADCVRDQWIHVEVHALPVVSLSLDDSYCQGEPAFIPSGGLPADPPGVYSLNGSPISLFDPSGDPGSYELAYTYTDPNGCSASAIQQIIIHPLPQVVYPPQSAWCDNDAPEALTGATPEGGIYAINGTPLSVFDPASGAGSYAATYVFTDANGCSNAASQTLVVHPSPVPSVAFDAVCQDLPFHVTHTSTISSGSISACQWTFGEGQTAQSFQPGPILPGSAGQYALHLHLVSDQGCQAALDTTYVIHPVPSALFTSGTGCEHEPIAFISGSTIETGEITSWTWWAGDSTAGHLPIITHSYADYEGASMTLVVSSTFGCDDSLTLPVLVRPVPDITLDIPAICAGTEAQMSAQATIAYGGITGQSWDFGDGSPGETGPTADHLYAGPGNHTLTFTAQSSLGCTSMATHPVEVKSGPVVEFVLDTPDACAGTSVGMLSTSFIDPSSEIVSWEWFVDGMQIAQEESANVQIEQPGSYHVRLVVTSSDGCRADSTALHALQIYPVPKAGFQLGSDELQMSVPVVEVTDDSSEDVVFWEYDFGDGTTASFEEGTHTYQTWDTYLITQVVQNAFGCSDTATRRVEVNPELVIYIPNAFTPDGNGNNDVFSPVLHGFTPVFYELQIFDRWGNIVFQTRDTEEPWNGQYLNTGEMSQDGVYNWQLDIRSEDSPVVRRMNGVVTLLR